MRQVLTMNKILPEHTGRLAIVYIRLAVRPASQNYAAVTAPQYLLVERALQLGWPRETVEVYDRDVGIPSSATKDRDDFQSILIKVNSERAGAVLIAELSRLSRSRHDLHQFFRTCEVQNTLVITENDIYNLRESSDRTLLGLEAKVS